MKRAIWLRNAKLQFISNAYIEHRKTMKPRTRAPKMDYLAVSSMWRVCTLCYLDCWTYLKWKLKNIDFNFLFLSLLLSAFFANLFKLWHNNDKIRILDTLQYCKIECICMCARDNWQQQQLTTKKNRFRMEQNVGKTIGNRLLCNVVDFIQLKMHTNRVN